MSNESNGKAVLVVGRLVWGSGDLFKGQDVTDFNTKQPKFNPDGTPKKQYGFGLAVPKDKANEMFAAMNDEAALIYASRQYPPDFAWKVKDGDTGVDQNGQPFSQREGYPGHFVFACTTSLPVKWFRRLEDGRTTVQVNEGIKVGDWVWAQILVKGHGKVGQGKPGLYLNPGMVMFLQYGQEIINSPSPDSVFGAQMPQAPAGSSPQPMAPQGVAFPAAPQAAPAAPGLPPMGQPQYAPPMQPQAPAAPQPYTQVLPPQFQAPQAPQPMAPPMPGPAPQAFGAPPFPQYPQR